MITEQEKNTIFALTLLAIVRKAVKTSDSVHRDDPQIEDKIHKLVETLQAEIRNILIEHLTNDQISHLAARYLCQEITGTIREFLITNAVMHGDISLDGLIAPTERFCSQILGREVKV